MSDIPIEAIGHAIFMQDQARRHAEWLESERQKELTERVNKAVSEVLEQVVGAMEVTITEPDGKFVRGMHTGDEHKSVKAVREAIAIVRSFMPPAQGEGGPHAL